MISAVERSGNILSIQLNRPAKKNAMTSSMYVTIAELLDAAATDDQYGSCSGMAQEIRSALATISRTRTSRCECALTRPRKCFRHVGSGAGFPQSCTPPVVRCGVLTPTAIDGTRHQ